MATTVQPDDPFSLEKFRRPPREVGILPFWFLNGELDPKELRFQLRELRDKGMLGVVFHARYGLELPYLGSQYLDRIQLCIEECERLGLDVWFFDEMNWPSGTADKQVLRERPDLVQRYLECVTVHIRGPWFVDLAAIDSRYLDLERSTPVAAFALSSDGRVLDLMPNLSFKNILLWQVPPGDWQVLYFVEKYADYYIDALNPESTAEFLRLGYEPYLSVTGNRAGSSVRGFYTDEPAMHYFLTSADNFVVPWTKDMFRRFEQRNGYPLRPHLPALFFDTGPDTARVRYDFYNTLTDLYSDAYFRQIHDWCRQRDLLFTGHLLYEESLRYMARVSGNPFKLYRHLDIIGVDHLYPAVGTQDRPADHVAIKLASSAAHQQGSPHVLCESFAGIFMDATMQRMKWIADWEYVLGVNLLNPHGFHYSLEGPRKREWPPSMFYQYPWWRHYSHFSDYIGRLSHLLSGGRHIAKVAVLWPIHAMFGVYTPQARSAVSYRMEQDFYGLSDLLLRLHHDYDYLDEDTLAQAPVGKDGIKVGDETYELLVLPPMVYIKLETVARLEEFVAKGGRLLGAVLLPAQAYGPQGLIDVRNRMAALFGIDPAESRAAYTTWLEMEVIEQDHPAGGKTAFVKTCALARQLPFRLQRPGLPSGPENARFEIETEQGVNRYYSVSPAGERQEITAEVLTERQQVADVLGQVIGSLIEPDVIISNPEIVYLHRQKEGRDVYFLVNSTHFTQAGRMAIQGDIQPLWWDPVLGVERPVAPVCYEAGRTHFNVTLPPVGSALILAAPAPDYRIVDTNLVVESVEDGRVQGYGPAEGYIVVEHNGQQRRLAAPGGDLPPAIEWDGDWEFETAGDNALVVGRWLAAAEIPGRLEAAYAGPEAEEVAWTEMAPGAWSYQLPAEPDQPYPIPVWYRVTFQVSQVPSRLALLVDGFAGSDWRLFVNGRQPDAVPGRSAFDSQIKAIDISGLVQPGENAIAIRLTLAEPTDGLLDPIKLVGEFSLEPRNDGGYIIAGPRRKVKPAPWTTQGYPFFSGQGVYRCRFQLPDAFAGLRVFLEPQLTDDALEIVVNDRTASIRLWEPYEVEITPLLLPGENELELRVTNTPVNLLEATPRISGLVGPPRLVAYRQYTFQLHE